ncbi:MAG TPA: hypothetical protein VGM64_04540 [Lacunisphaera sp.]|jgi:hypothetical protein
MRKLLNNPWFVAVMAIAALAFVARSMLSGGPRFGLSGTVGAAPAGADTGQTSEAESRANLFAVVRNLQLPAPIKDPFAIRIKVDPTAEKVEVPDAVESVHLSAVWSQDGKTLVLINDRIFQKGDEIGRIKIESASEEGVWITHWKGRNFVRVGGDFTLNTPMRKSARAASSL